MNYLGILGGMLAIINFAYMISRNLRGDEAKRIKEYEQLNARVGLLETKIEIFWKGVSYSSAQVLHSPHTPELDTLIEKFQRDDINDTELARFKLLLHEVQADANETTMRRKAASEVLTLIKVRYEVSQAAGTS